MNHKDRDRLAWIQHEIWSHWMTYQLSVCEKLDDGSMLIPADKVARWKRQMNTDFNDLSEQEKQSDYHQADKVMGVLGL